MTDLEIITANRERDMKDAFAIRVNVFCREQGVSEDIEIDGLDDQCRHYLARRGGAALGTARVRPYGARAAKIERVAVLAIERENGVGRALMECMIADLGADGVATVVLNAQTAVEAFYARLGFISEGDIFMEAGIPHVRMTMKPAVR